MEAVRQLPLFVFDEYRDQYQNMHHDDGNLHDLLGDAGPDNDREMEFNIAGFLFILRSLYTNFKMNGAVYVYISFTLLILFNFNILTMFISTIFIYYTSTGNRSRYP